MAESNPVFGIQGKSPVRGRRPALSVNPEGAKPAAEPKKVVNTDSPIAQARKLQKKLTDRPLTQLRRGPLRVSPNGVKPADLQGGTPVEKISDYLEKETDAQQGQFDETETEAVAEKKAAPAKKEIPDWLANKLAEHDLDAADFASPEAATKYLNKLRRSPQRQEQTQQEQRQEAKKFDLFEGFDKKELEAEFGPLSDKLLGLIEKSHKYADERLEKLVQHVMYQQRELDKSRSNEIDSIFESANESYEGAFGTGSYGELNDGGMEQQLRQDVAETAHQILNSARGQNLSMKSAFKRAMEIVLGPKPAKKPAKAAKVVEPVEDEEELEIPEAIAKRSRNSVGFGDSGSRKQGTNGRAAALGKISQFLRS